MATSPASKVEAVDLLRRATEAGFAINLQRLCDLIAIPSISAGSDSRSLEPSAAAVAGYCTEIGLPEVDLLTVDDSPPYVLARWRKREDAPTLLLYAHYDVQPIGDPDSWSSNPFSPTLRDGRLYGRGSADDKAGILIHLAAIESWLTSIGELPVNVTVLVEGEEEVGSRHFTRLLEEHGTELDAQFAVLADGMHCKTGVPTLTHSLRGVASFVVTLRALERPLHSGYFGGPVPDPVTAMCVLLGSLVDERGVPVLDVTGAASARSRPGDHGGLRRSVTEAEFRAEAGVLPGVRLVGPEHAALADKLWEAATLTVIGMDVPRIRDASNTIQPTCRARISLRLPPDCDPPLAAAALTTHLRHHVPWGLDFELAPVSLQPGWRGNPAGPLSSAAARAFADSYGAPCAFVGLGGTIPFVRPFLDAAGHPDCVITGVGDPECAAHGPDESVSVADWRRACLGEALLLGELTEWDTFSVTRKAKEADDRKGRR